MPDLELPDMTKNPEVPVARPEVQQFAERDPNPVDSAAPLLVTEETTEARPDVNVPTQSPVRRRIQRSGLLPDLTVERRPTRGSVDQISPQFDSRREVASLDVPVDPSSFLRRANPTDEIVRRTGPTPAELPSEEAGVVADTVLEGGGRVIGVIPKALEDREVAHYGLTELHVVASMHERKAMMEDLSDAFIAMPGGIGTFEEILEILTWSQLKIHPKPSGLLNVEGYYDKLIALLDQAVASGFMPASSLDSLYVDPDPGPLLEACAVHPDRRALGTSGENRGPG